MRTLLVAVALALTACSGTTPRQTAPVSTAAPSVVPSSAAQAPAWTPERVLTDPASHLHDVAWLPGRPRVMAASWLGCRSATRCYPAHGVVVVTTDGFATRRVADLPQNDAYVLEAVPGAFVVRDDRRTWLLRPDGTTTKIHHVGRPAPLAAGEVVLDVGGRPAAVSPVSAVVHRLPKATPDVKDLRVVAGQLRGLAGTAHPRYVWSDDGGTTWREAALPAPDPRTPQPMWALGSTPDRRTHLVIQSGDGATLFPFVGWSTSTDPAQGWSSQPGPSRPTAYSTVHRLLPDGGLLVAVDDWSDTRWRQGRPVRGTSPGIFRADPAGGLSRLPLGAPFRRPSNSSIDSLIIEGRRWVMVAQDLRSAYSSTDLGRHWRRLSTR